MGCVGSNPEIGEPEGDFNLNSLITQTEGSFADHYLVGEQVGQGSYGKVLRCKHKQTKEIRAFKKMPIQIAKGNGRNKFIASDVQYLRQIDHPNVMKGYEFFKDNQFFYFVHEYIDGVNLYDKMENQNLLSELEVASYAQQILSVLVYIHNKGIVHRDLKPENIMLDLSQEKANQPQDDQLKQELCMIKVIDWGSGAMLNKNEKLSKIVGSPYYIAPEVLNQLYDEKADLWSLGISIYQLIAGEPPFQAENTKELFQKIIAANWSFNGIIWLEISEQCKDFIKNLLVKDPVIRASAQSALEHPWLKSAFQNELSDQAKSEYIQKLTKYRSKTGLHQVALTFLAQNCVSQNEKAELTRIFKGMDVNGDGVLSKDEIIKYFEEHLTEEEKNKQWQTLLQNVDIDNNDKINYNEFITSTINLQNKLSEFELKKAFEFFDLDKNNYITSEEIQKILGNEMMKKDKNTWTKLLKDADQNCDGKISYEEFKAMILQMI